MNYITVKAFNKKGIDGDFNLPLGTIVTETGNVLYHSNKRICFITSQNAYDHFSRNDDGHGTDRYALIQEIRSIIMGYVTDYNEEIAAINNGDLTDEQKETELANVVDKSSLAYDAIRNYKSELLKPNDNLFTYDFYSASISVLGNIKSLIENL